MKKIMSSLAITLFLSTTFLNTSARADTLYQVELIAFSRNSAAAENEENWDRQYTLRYTERTINLQAADSSGASFQMLGSDAMQLNKEADKIASHRNWHVLVHTTWRQSVDDPAHATAVILSGGKQFGTHHELEGTFTLSVEHFLRADVNLWLSRFSSSDTAVSAKTQTLPNPPGTVVPATNVPATVDNVSYVATQTIVMQEQRRLRSGELHYFDHPLLGLLVLVTPVTPTATNIP